MSDTVDNIYNTIINHIDEDAEINIVMEGISYGSAQRTKSVFDLAGLNYMIRYRIIRDKKTNFVIAPPSEIKKFASGNGNCKKEVMIELFKSMYPNIQLPKVDDIADAYFMARYSYKIYNDKK